MKTLLCWTTALAGKPLRYRFPLTQGDFDAF